MKRIDLTDQEFIELVCLITDSYQWNMQVYREKNFSEDEIDAVKNIMIPLYKKFDLEFKFKT